MLPALPGPVAALVGGVRTRLRQAVGTGNDRVGLVEALDAAALRVDDAGRVADLNGRATTVLGVERSVALGEPLEAVAPELADCDVLDGTVVEIEVDGVRRTFEVSAPTTASTAAADVAGAGDEADASAEMRASEGPSTVTGTSDTHPGGSGWLLLRDVTEAERHRRMVENLADAVYMTDADGEIVAVSDELAEQLGYERERFVGAHVSEFLSDAEYAVGVEAISEMVEAGEQRDTFECRAIHADGERRRYEDTVQVLTDDEGTLTGIVHSIRDVEERRTRERELEQYETIVETVPVGVFVVDENGAIEASNEQGATMLGYEATALEGTTLDELRRRGVLGPELPDHEVIADALLDGRTGGDAGTYELTLRPADGDDERVVEFQLALRPGESFTGFIGVVRDVTEHQHRLDELEQYEAIMEVLPDPVYATDAEGRLTFVNRAFEEQLGYPREDAGMHFSEFTTPADTEAVLDLLREMVGGGPERATAEIVVVTRDGRQLRVEDSLALLPSDGEFRGSAGVLRDVTERKRRQEVLTVMNRALRHNLRTNVSTIVGYADLLDEHVEGESEAESFVQHIRTSADWLAKLGDTLRTLQRAIEADIAEDGGADLTGIVESVVESIREDHPGADIEAHVATSVTLEAGWPLKYALENVLENAIVHHDRPVPAVAVWVADAPRDGWVDVHVEDDGPGIPESERDVVMGEATITQLKHGSGIGLWLTRWLVEVYDGELVIEDNDPRGTVVTLRLPRSAVV